MIKRILAVMAVVLGLASAGVAQSLDNVRKEKTAILMVHFGTTFDDTRAQTINAINKKAKAHFPGVKVAEGRRVGTAYQLENGEIIYIPE